MKGSRTLDRKDFLELLARSRNSKRRKLLAQWADKHDLLAVSEVLLNVLRGNVKLTPEQIKRLRRHRKSLRILAKKTASIAEKRRMISQHGGFLPFVLPTILGSVAKIAAPAILGSILKKTFGRK